MQSLMNNPRALQAMMQIQAGLSQLQLEAPSLNQGYELLYGLYCSCISVCQRHTVKELAVGFAVLKLVWECL